MGLNFDDFLKAKPELNRYITENNCKFGEGGRRTPIPNEYLRTLPNNEVIMNYEVFRKLWELANKTIKTCREQAFILVANNTGRNSCFIDTVFESNINTFARHYEFDKNMIKYLDDLANNVRNGRISPRSKICICRTHASGRRKVV